MASSVASAVVIVIKTPVTLGALGTVMAVPGAGVATVSVAVLLVANLVLLLACIASAALPADRGRRLPPALPLTAAVIGLAAAASACATDGGRLTEAQDQLLPMNAVTELQFALVLFVARPRRAAVAIAATAPAYLVLRVFSLGGPSWEAAGEWILTSSGALAFAVLVPYLRSSAERSDRAAEDAERAAARLAALEAEERAAEEAHRVVHDEVISTLRGVELGLPLAAVGPAAERALAALRGRRRSGRARDPRDLLDRIVEASPVAVDLEVREWTHLPPPALATAVEGAAAEALRNVQRHSGVARAVVHASEADGWQVLTIRDHGRGMGDAPAGFGLRESIGARLAEAGAHVELSTPDDGGTLVRMSWPAREREVVTDRAPLVVEEQRRRTYLLVALPFVAANVVTALGHDGGRPLPTLGVAALAAALAVGAAMLMGRRAPRTAEVAAFGGGVCAVTALGLVVAGPGALMTLDSWVVGACSVTIALLAFEAALLPVSLVVLAQMAVVVAAAALDPTVAPLQPIGALVVPVLLGGVAAILGTLLRASRVPIADHEVTLRAAAAHEAWNGRFAVVRARQLDEVAARVVPLLDRVLAVPPASTEVASDELRAAARTASQQCRDDLPFTRPLSAAAHRALARLRAEGAEVAIRGGDERMPPEAVEALLEYALAGATRAEHITIFPAHAGCGPRLVLRPGLVDDDLRALAAQHGLRLRVDEERTELEGVPSG